MKQHTPLHECNYIYITYSARLKLNLLICTTAPFTLRDHTENRYNSASIETA